MLVRGNSRACNFLSRTVIVTSGFTVPESRHTRWLSDRHAIPECDGQEVPIPSEGQNVDAPEDILKSEDIVCLIPRMHQYMDDVAVDKYKS